jgi:DNA-binding response OmpR family regulator
MPPLLVLTADGRAKDKGASIGAEAALTKPFDLMDLLETISKLLSNK